MHLAHLIVHGLLLTNQFADDCRNGVYFGILRPILIASVISVLRLKMSVQSPGDELRDSRAIGGFGLGVVQQWWNSRSGPQPVVYLSPPR